MNEDQNPDEELNPKGANPQDGHQEDALDAQIIGEDQEDFDSPQTYLIMKRNNLFRPKLKLSYPGQTRDKRYSSYKVLNPVHKIFTIRLFLSD
mgnify:CR=1 FL=1